MALADTARLISELVLQDKFSGPAGRIGKSLSGLERGFSQMGRGAGQLGTGIGRVATVAATAAAGGLAAVITTAASMEEAFTGVQKTVDETADVSFAQLRQVLRDMSSETGTAFEELSRIGEIGGALGVGIESLDEFIDVVNRLGVSTDLSVDDAATALGQLGTTLHLTGSEFRSFSDTLVALGNAGASTEPQIVDLAARFAAAGNRAGLSSNEILALSSAVTSMGVEVEAGGTALSQTFNNIALAIGTGSDEVEGFTEVLGISAGEFRRRWETDALGTFQDFLKELSKLDPIAQAVALDMAGITGQRQLSAIGLMADNYGFVADQLLVAESATGSLGEESDKFFGTSAAGFRRLRENVRLAADTVGTELLPVVNELITEFVDWLNDPAQQRGLKEFGQNLASGIRDFAKEIRSADFGQLLETFKGAAAIAKTAFDAFRSLPGPIQQLILAAVVANKVTGGGVSMIAQGIGNILAGTIRVAFTGALRGLLPAAAGTAINRVLAQPVLVTNWPPGLLAPGAGGAGGAAALGGGNITRFLGFATGIGLASFLGIELGKAIADELGFSIQDQAGTEIEAEKNRVSTITDTGTGAQQLQTLKDIDGALNTIAGLAATPILGPVQVFLAGDQIQILKDQKAALLAELSVGERIAYLTGKNYEGVVKQAVIAERVAAVDASIGAAARADHADAMAIIPDTALIADNTTRLPELPDIVTQVKSAIGSAAQADHADAAAARATLNAAKERIAAQVAASGANQNAKAEAIAAAVRTNTGVLVGKNFAPKIGVTTNVVSRVTISELQRTITSQQIAQSTAIGGGGFAV